jgi:uncharacterized membrane protein
MAFSVAAAATVRRYLVAYIATGVGFALIDAVWLNLVYARLYAPLLAPVLHDGVRLAPAVAFYLFYIAGIMVFALRPAFAAGRWQVAAGYGALFGFFAYMTYDLTNQATLRVWSVSITVADIAWGTTLTALAATIGYLATAGIGNRQLH